MKRSLIVAVSMMFNAAFAQKAVKGDITTEIGVSLSTTGSTINSFGLNSRYFTGNKLAVAAGLTGSYTRSQDVFTEYASGSGDRGTFTTTSQSLEFSLGIQRYFTGTNRLSPFIGADFFIGTGSTKYKGDDADANRYKPSYSYHSNARYRRPGFRIAFGFDYWFTQGMYIGAIYQPVSLSYLMESDNTVTTIQNGVTSNVFNPGGTGLTLNTGSRIGSIRLGWTF